MAERKFPDWATNTINLVNGDPNKLDPGGTKQANGWAIEKPIVGYMNWLQNLISHFVRANNEFKREATTYEAEAGEIVQADNTAAAATVDLPLSPVDGQWVVVGGLGKYSLFPVYVDGNGNDIMVAADQTCELDIDCIMFIFHWNATDNMWKISKHILNGAIQT